MSSAALTIRVKGVLLKPLAFPNAVAIFQLDSDPDNAKINYSADMSVSYGDGRARFEFPPSVIPGPTTASGNIFILPIPGYKIISAPTRDYVGNPEWGTIELEPSVVPFPQPLSRDEICGVQLTLQGLPVVIPSGIYAGTYPDWFETALQCLELENRLVVYEVKRGAGDRHQIIEFFSGKIYDEPGQEFENFISPDYPNDPQAFLDLTIEVILAGFTPIVVYDGDNADDPINGGPNALRQLPILDELFKNTQYGDIRPYILFGRLWDGVFYGSSPENIQAFGQAFRALNPNGYLAIEHSTGHIPLGEGPSDWTLTGRMCDYDVILSEFNNWPVTGDATWQIAGRLLGPDYIRPPNQPQDDDPSPPFYLAEGSPRGSYYAIAFEWGAYPGVRWQYTPQDYINGRNYYKALGYKFVC